MLKKKLIYIFCLIHIAGADSYAQVNQPTKPSAKIVQLNQLQDIVQKINRIKPVGHYLLAVPPYIEFTSQDLRQFLSAVPSNYIDPRSRRKQQPISMFDYIEMLNFKVYEQAHRFKKITPLMREYLIEIRQAIEDAFRHDLLNGPLRPEVRSFLERQREQKNELIIRPAPETPLYSLKGCFPLSAQDVQAGIAYALTSFYSEKSILEQINNNSLDSHVSPHFVIQSIVAEDAASQDQIVSGTSCSYDETTHSDNIITIKSTFGDAKAMRRSDSTYDSFYVHDNMVYPVIRKKINRFTADASMRRSRLIPNAQTLQSMPSLDLQAAQEIARATKLLEEIYQQPICITFIKRDNTIYIIKVQTPDISCTAEPSYFDPLYTEHIIPEKKIAIFPLNPSHTLTVIKKKEKVILAPNVQTLITQLAKRKKPEDVVLGIVKTKPGPQSKEMHMLETINIPVIWTPDFEQLRNRFNEIRKFPLVFDMQQRIAFPFARCRGFCTLFQGVQSGIYAHPAGDQISVLPTFFPPLNPGEREMLKPDEHFSGVTVARLFDLVKFGSLTSAKSALNTLLFRLQKQIMFEHITKKECAAASQPFDTTRCDLLEQMYARIERVAYELLKKLDSYDEEQNQATDALERIFLTNVLHALILQQPDTNIVGTESFMHIAQTA